MKDSLRTLFLSLILLLISFTGYTQENYIDSLKKTLPTQKEDTGKLILLNKISTYFSGNDHDSTVKYAQLALNLAEQLHIENEILIAELQLTNALTFLGNYPMAMDFGFKASALAKKTGSFLGNILSMGNLGLCYHYQGDFIAELKYVQSAVKMVEVNYPDSLAFIYAGLSMAFEDLNQHDSALIYAKKSYKQLKEWHLEDWFSSIYPQLGNAFAGKAEFDSALFYFRKGITVSISQNFSPDEFDSYNGMAKVYKEKGELDSAIWYANKVLAHKFGKSYRDGMFKAATLLASVYKSKSKPDSALKYLQIAIDIKDSLFNRQKTIAIQNLENKERQKQLDLEASRRAYQGRLRMWVLIGGLAILMIIALFQWRNNLQRKKAFALLQKQERETDRQKQKVEQSLIDLKATQSQLIQSEKMASLGEMTAGIAHEIQNPLNFVNNFAEINRELIAEVKIQQLNTKKRVGDERVENELLDDIEQNLEKISHHGMRADAIVKSMLQHSRTSSGQKEPTDINALADEYMRLAYHGLRGKDNALNVTLETEFDPAIKKVNVIPQEIGRVLLNLFNNAFYAVSEKKKLVTDNFQPRVTVSTKIIGDNLEICVRDNGQGIPEKLKGKIFQPFFTTKPSGKGTGLGLSLSHDIIKAHQGELKVESTEGEGTTMIIHIPV